jgi:hypothetical protein
MLCFYVCTKRNKQRKHTDNGLLINMTLENEHAIITDEEEIKKLFPSPLLPFGALELSSQRRNDVGTNNRIGAGKKDHNKNEIEVGEGGVRSRVPAVCTDINGSLLLPDSQEYLSKLERMVIHVRAKHQCQPSAKQPRSEIELDSIVGPVVQNATEDDERAPFIKVV